MLCPVHVTLPDWRRFGAEVPGSFVKRDVVFVWFFLVDVVHGDHRIATGHVLRRDTLQVALTMMNVRLYVGKRDEQ
jgi:hypothetical protein